MITEGTDIIHRVVGCGIQFVNIERALLVEGHTRLTSIASLMVCCRVKTVDGFDTRNYGLLLGIPEARELFADLMGVEPKNVVMYGTASLTIMYD